MHYQYLQQLMTQKGFYLDTQYQNGLESWRIQAEGRIIINYLNPQTGSGYLRMSLLEERNINYQHILYAVRGNIGQEGFQIKVIPWADLSAILNQL